MGTKQNILVVGAGFSGSVIARQLANIGHQITVIDQRDHIGGNCYDYIKNDVRIHKYGPHIFHTANKTVFDWLSQFTNWANYEHQVTALYNNQFYTFPPTEHEIKLFGDKIVDIFYKPYTKKMWDTDINDSILKRVRSNSSGYYFPTDQYQGFPLNGYRQLFENILNHKNISINLNTKFDKNQELNFDCIFNSMSIDEYYDYCFGILNYRSIKFYHITNIDHIMPTAVVNYTDDNKFTRVVKWDLFPNHGCGNIFTLEEPCNYKDNNNERYYPINDIHNINRTLYNQYKSIPNQKTIFIGRCGLYTYIDMDQAVASALSIVKKFTK